jgi:hypothetical protein
MTSSAKQPYEKLQAETEYIFETTSGGGWPS